MKLKSDLLREDHRRADRLMLIIVWCLFGMALCLSALYQTFWLAVTIGGALALVSTVLVTLKPGRRITRYTNAVVLMAMAALHIHQGAGMTELHFGIFVLLAFLLCYRDVATILIGAAVIALHHLSFDFLQGWGVGVRCFTNPSLGMVLIHAGYVVGETAVLCFLAQRLYQDTAQATELKNSAARLGEHEGRVNLTPADNAAATQIGKLLQQSVRTVHDAVASAIASVRRTRGSSTTIAELNTALRSTTEEQRDLVRDAIASMTELTADVVRNIDGTRHATSSAAQASAVAAQGGAAVAQVVSMMGQINASSGKIVEIITVIDHIAFQTNILALNAAVEAARAGEQGRGFAVVAAEVRQLAQRSASAAREIKELIEATVRSVEQGNGLVDNAGQTIRLVVDSVVRMNAIIGDIASSSEKQAEATRLIERELAQIGELTDRKVAMVESAAEAALDVERSAQELELQMGQFDIAGQAR